MSIPTSVQHLELSNSLAAAAKAAQIESPSLSVSVGPDIPAFELKFLLSETQADAVLESLRGRLMPDAHSDPNLGNAYRTTSLYCDTPQLDVFHRRGSCKRRKHRLRRYAQEPWVFLERKSKWGDRVKKQRTLVPDSELMLLANPMSCTTWAGHWFHRHVLRRQLQPMCHIAYERVALVGMCDDGPLRLTFDRNVRGIFTDAWFVEEFQEGLSLLTGRVICEFKYRAAMPLLFKQVIQSLQLTPSPVSKYRTFLRASGRADNGRAVDA